MVNIKKNIVEVFDDWLMLFYKKTQVFYSYEFSDYYIQNLYPGSIFTSGRFYNIFFTESETNETFQRNVITLWDVISELGGISEILIISCYALVFL